LDRCCPEAKTIATYSNVKDCVKNILSHPPDILLLDINLSDGTGFDVLKEISELETRVIFITAYEEFAIEAFKYHVDNYLLKPINPKDLQLAISDSIFKIKSRREFKDLKLLHDKSNSKKIGIPLKGSLHIMNLHEIIRCEANGNYTYIIRENNEKVIVPKTIKKFEELLKTEGFIRSHQSHLINQQFIKEIQKKDNFITLTNNESIPVSRKYKPSVLDAFKFKFL
jgi:two-component system LytT family response regulator